MSHLNVEPILFGFSIYALPILIIVTTVIAVSEWPDRFPQYPAEPLKFRYIDQTDSPLDPASALEKLQHMPEVSTIDSILHEASFWFLVKVPPTLKNDLTAMELPVRQIKEFDCWDSEGLRPLGHATRDETHGAMFTARTGFAVSLGKIESSKTLLCNAKFAGSPIITFAGWPYSELEQSMNKFHRDSGLLEGGLMMLVVFSILAAIINKDLLYLLFAAWLVVTLRVASISAGWDMQWFGYNIPGIWLLPMRKFSFVTYYILTTVLFSKLFAFSFKQKFQAFILNTVQWSCLPLLALSILLPYTMFLPWLWAITGMGVLGLMYLLVHTILKTQSKVAVLYGLAIAIILITSVSEVVAAALGLRGALSFINHVTGALLSSLVVALAIAEHMRLERQEKITAQAELKHTYDAMPIGLFTLDEQGLLLSFNPALQSLLLIPAASSEQNRHWRNYFSDEIWERLVHACRTEDGCDMEVPFHPRNSTVTRWVQIKAAFAQGKIEGSLQDVTVRHIASEKLRFLADHDPLTGILNRRGIENALTATIEGLGEGQSAMLAYLDLDRFKLINDLYGHIAGDDVLRQVCQRLLKILNGDHIIGRLGGDEFIILFRQGTVQSNSLLCEHLLSTLETRPYQVDGKAFQLKASVGLVEITGDIRVTDAISAADRACREAKNGLKGHLQTYEKSAAFFRERESELKMIECFSGNRVPEGLFLEMQPIMSLREPFATHNFETLIRMREPDGTIIPAHRIITAAENNGNSGVIDRWVLSTILGWLDDHLTALDKTRFVCLNLSGASLNDERFIEDAFSILANHPRSSERVCIEITESVALNDLSMTRRFIDGARKYGSKIALDDFGAGYTSFSYLRELPADAVKIDGSFVRDVCKHPTNLSIVSTIAELARNLGMKSIAEWAEDLPSVEALAEVGVDYVQGWAISKPQSAERILSVSSSAELILDPVIARFVREQLPAKTQQGGFMPFSLH